MQAKYSTLGNVNKTTYSGDGTKNYYKEDDFDYYAVYLPEIDQCIYPSIKYGGAHFRFTKCNSATPFYWYEDFLEFTENFLSFKYNNINDFHALFLCLLKSSLPLCVSLLYPL